MRGLSIVGTSRDADEAGVGHAACAALRDERALLGGSVLLGDELNAGQWLESTGGPELAARVTIDAFEEWEARSVGDPRSTSRGEIMAALEAEMSGGEPPHEA